MKNLLFITGLHAGMLEKQLGEPEQLEHVDVILNTIQKAGSLASHLTGFSSRKSMQLAAADPCTGAGSGAAAEQGRRPER
jgi:hypothetical protein